MATYYVNPSTGTDVATGTSPLDAWGTLQKAADTAVAGDVVLCMATATESPLAAIDFDTNSGDTTSGPIRFVAADASGNPVTDGSTKYHVDDANLASGSLLNVTASAQSIAWIGFDFRCGVGSATVCIGGDVTNGLSGWFMQNCRVRGGSSAGVQHRAGTAFVAVGCEFDGNGVAIDADGESASGRSRIIACSIHDNTSHGVTLASSFNDILGCVFYDNGGNDIRGTGATDNSTFAFNTHDGTTGSVIVFTSTNPQNITVVGCSFGNIGAYAIEPFGTQHFVNANSANLGWNHYHNLTSGYIKNGSGTVNAGEFGFNNVEGDPEFVSTTDGSEDYHLGEDSPLIAAGPLGKPIGALPVDPDAIGGGGGAVVFAGLQALEAGVMGVVT